MNAPSPANPSGKLQQALAVQRRRESRRLLWMGILLLVLLGTVLADIFTGPSLLPFREVIDILMHPPFPALGFDHPDAADGLVTIVWDFRLPVALMAIVVGAALGLGGAEMQTLLDNPLASPFTLGFSAAAGFGAALAIMFGGLLPVPGYALTPAAAFGMTLAACALIYLLALARGANPEVLILGGIAVLFFFQSVQSLLQYIASPEILQQIVFWLFGDLQKASWTSVSVCAVVLLACLPFVARDAWALTALRLGDANAMSIGVPVQAIRRRAFVLVALLTAVAVCFVGTIGFVGLIAPHMARALVGEDHRFALPLAALTGALILSGASVFAKLISPGAVVPVGIITAVAGVPMLLGIIVSRKGGI